MPATLAESWSNARNCDIEVDSQDLHLGSYVLFRVRGCSPMAGVVADQQGSEYSMDNTQISAFETADSANISPWRIVGWACAGIIVVSVGACVVMAGIRSVGLTQVTVTALDADSEPRDHSIPFIKQKEALPDYEVVVVLATGGWIHLGARPDQSAVDGLTWRLTEPVSVKDVAGIRLQDQDRSFPMRSLKCRFWAIL